MPFELALHALVALFVVIDPIGTAAIFLALAQGRDWPALRAMAIKGVLVATGLMLLFAILGAQLLEMLGISLPAFRVAGGLLLFYTAFNMVMSHPEPTKAYSHAAEGAGGTGDGRADLSVFPLAIPLLAGPGCITTIILLMEEAQRESGNWLAIAAVIISLLVVQGVALACLLGAARLKAVLGQDGINLIGRVFGILLAALAIEFIATGVRGLVAA